MSMLVMILLLQVSDAESHHSVLYKEATRSHDYETLILIRFLQTETWHDMKYEFFSNW